jgi:hypothetical protein
MKRRSALTSDVLLGWTALGNAVWPALQSSIPQRHFILPLNFVVLRAIPGRSLVLLYPAPD